MVKVKIKDDCIGCGACAAIAPDIFEIDPETMKSKVKKQPETEEEINLVKEAMEACPTESIVLEE